MPIQPINPDWVEPTPLFSPNEGEISGSGLLTFSPWYEPPRNNPPFIGSLRAHNVVLSVLEEPPELSVNANYSPNKLYYGRLTQMLGNWVIKEVFLSFRNQMLNYRNLTPWTVFNVSDVVNAYIFNVNANFGATMFDVHPIDVVYESGLYSAAPIFKLGYDLQPGVRFYYGWI